MDLLRSVENLTNKKREMESFDTNQYVHRIHFHKGFLRKEFFISEIYF